ncbi:AlpA family transcriptional regulator [uncultured Tateyamaria sp.]|uniref:helix-turn-helix transcriptional regulator n=1 Tax=uncultured Tateyamaria sp. TaxID=455651 RepID=UPI00262D1073|nr:AlpA family phage regulatory protein [uncultured Tateyamaria sp.]
MSDRFLSPKTTSEMVSLPARSIRRMVAQGKFPKSFPVGQKRVAYLESQVVAWMNERLKAAGLEPSIRILSPEKETLDQGLTAPEPVQVESSDANVKYVNSRRKSGV